MSYTMKIGCRDDKQHAKMKTIHILATVAVWGFFVATIVLLWFLPYARKGVK